MLLRTIVMLMLGAGLGAAQQRTTSFRAGTLHLLQGRVSIDGKRIVMRGGITPPVQIRNGQRVHVDRGRVEFWLGPGAALTMSDGSTLRMQENDLSDVQLVVEQGSALVKVTQVFEGGRLRVMAPDGAVEMAHTGWYHFEANPQRLRVYRGTADVELGDAVIKAKKGDSVDLTQLAGSLSRFDLKKMPDALIAWENQLAQEAQASERRFEERRALMRARSGIQSDEQQQARDDRKRAQQTPNPNPGMPPAQ